MKGVSPIVASVILISVAVVAGVMVSTWVTHWTSTQTSTTQSCAINTQYVIDSATFTGSTNETRVKITNKGSEGIYGFEITVDNGTDITRFSAVTDSINTSTTSKLTQGNSAYLNVRTAGNFNISVCNKAKEIRVTNRACSSVMAKTETITQA